MLSRILKTVWLLIAVVSFYGALITFRNTGFMASLPSFLMAAIGVLMFVLEHKRSRNK